MNEYFNNRHNRNYRPSVRVISFTSGKGGVGKSQTVTNLAVALANLGSRVLILDADMGLANLDIMFNVRPKYTLFDVFYKDCGLQDTIVTLQTGVDLIPASSGVSELTKLSSMQKLHLLNKIDELEDQYDFLLIDTASGISDDVLYFNVAAEEIIIITTPEPTAMADAYAIMKVLHQRFKEKEFKLLVNFAQDEAQAIRVYDQLTKVADQFLPITIHWLGYLPHDSVCSSAIKERIPVLCKNPDTKISLKYQEIAKQIFQSLPCSSGKGSVQFFWKKLLTGNTLSTESICL